MILPVLGMTWVHYLLAAGLFFVCFLLIVIILLQKGRGGGVGAALGGAGGNTAFGAKTGDVFTVVTVVFAGVFLLLAVVSNYAFRQTGSTTAAAPGAAPGAGPETPIPVNPGGTATATGEPIPIQIGDLPSGDSEGDEPPPGLESPTGEAPDAAAPDSGQDAGEPSGAEGGTPVEAGQPAGDDELPPDGKPTEEPG